MRYLLLLLVLFSFSVSAYEDDTAHNKALAESAALEAKDEYEKAFNFKVANKFEDARILYENLAEDDEPGTEQWSKLAKDELRYGLLMHEVNYWLIKPGGMDKKGSPGEGYLNRAQQLLYRVIELNADNSERILNAQQKLAQISFSKQALANSSRQNDLGKLAALRVALNLYYQDRGSWPNKQWMKNELQSALLVQGASKKLWVIQNYWKTSTSFYLLLKNSTNGATAKMKGNKKGGVSWE